MLGLFTIPTADTLITSSTSMTYSFFNAYWPIVAFSSGLIFGSMAILFVIFKIKNGLHYLFSKQNYNEAEQERLYNLYWRGPNAKEHYQKHWDDKFKF